MIIPVTFFKQCWNSYQFVIIYLSDKNFYQLNTDPHFTYEQTEAKGIWAAISNPTG